MGFGTGRSNGGSLGVGMGVNGVSAAVSGDSMSVSGLVSAAGSLVSVESGSVAAISAVSAEVDGLGGSSPVGVGTGRLDTLVDREPSIIFAHHPWSDENARIT